MTAEHRELEQYLHAHIPLSAAMGVTVVDAADEAITLSAPLAPNINHRDTVFGGSAAAMALLAAWSLLHRNLQTPAGVPQLVIQRNTMEYLEPISGRFTARAERPAAVEWERFNRTLARRGRARLTVISELHCAGRLVARLEGEFVAAARERAGFAVRDTLAPVE